MTISDLLNTARTSTDPVAGTSALIASIASLVETAAADEDDPNAALAVLVSDLNDNADALAAAVNENSPPKSYTGNGGLVTQRGRTRY